MRTLLHISILLLYFCYFVVHVNVVLLTGNCGNVACGSTLTNVNFDADRFPPMIKEALEYREQMKQLYESECQRAGTSPRQFSQSEATWMPAADVWVGPTEQLEAEGSW